MENTQRIAIFKMALEAAQASIDAHGHAVEPLQAWEFMVNMTDDDDLGWYSHLDAMPAEFARDYKRLVGEFAKGNQFVTGSVKDDPI